MVRLRSRQGDGTQQTARRLLLATGVADVLPEIDGLRALWGPNRAALPVLPRVGGARPATDCAGHHPTAVLLAARLAAGFSDDVVACTNGTDMLDDEQRGLLSLAKVTIREEPIARLDAEQDSLRRIVFADGAVLERQALFVHPGQRQRSDLARRLGCRLLDDDAVEVDDLQQTSITGVFAAGDMARRSQMPTVGAQVGISAAEGIAAAVAIDQELAWAAFAANHGEQ